MMVKLMIHQPDLTDNPTSMIWLKETDFGQCSHLPDPYSYHENENTLTTCAITTIPVPTRPVKLLGTHVALELVLMIVSIQPILGGSSSTRKKNVDIINIGSALGGT